MKEVESQRIDTSMLSLKSLGFPTLVIVHKDRIELHIGQEASLAPIPQSQGETQKEGDKTQELKLTTVLEEKIAIQTLVTLPISTTLLSSQALQRLST